MVDQQRARDIASDAVDKAGKVAGDAASQARAAVHSTLEQGKSMAQDLAHQASGFGRQAMGRAGEVMQDVAPRAGEQAKQATSNLYDQGSRAGEQVRQYVVEQPLAALLIAGAIGYALKPVQREELWQAFQRLDAKLSQALRRILVIEDEPGIGYVCGSASSSRR